MFVRWLGRRSIATYLGLLIAGLVLENVGLSLLIPLINGIDTGGRSEMNFGPIAIQGEIWLFGTLVAGAIGLRVVAALYTIAYGSRLTNGWNDRMRIRLHDALHDPRAVEPRSMETGELLNTVMGQTWSASEYCRAQLNLASRAVAVLAYGLVLIWLSWVMTAGLLLAAVPLGLMALRFNRQTRKISTNLVELNNSLYNTAVASIGAQFTIAAYGLGSRFRSSFKSESNGIRNQSVQADINGAVVPQLLSLIVVPVVVALGLFGRSQAMPTGEVVVFVLVLYRAIPQASGAIGAFNETFRHRASFENIIDRLDSWLPSDTNEPVEEISTIDTIELDQLTFGYNGSSPIIKNFNAVLTDGRSYQLHGSSGAGKSTMLSLILGLLAPVSGQVKINGRSLDRLDLASVRSQIGYAGQRSSILEATLEDNIYLWRGVSPERRRDVEDVLGITAFTSALPDGGATRIGTGGVAISGGQEQRVAIARALCSNPSFIILDEATSELDNESEKQVLDAVGRLCPNAIVLIVSHRHGNVADQHGGSLAIEGFS